MEAFSYANQKVEDYYSSEGNLQTEHPVLDDNGDAKATRQARAGKWRGLLARTLFWMPAFRSENPKSLDSGTAELERGGSGTGKTDRGFKIYKDEMPRPSMKTNWKIYCSDWRGSMQNYPNNKAMFTRRTGQMDLVAWCAP